tara:strand:- start:5845 stop:7062 length:1218 start_codon:yes stop_codon:yes gene_type:complete
MSIFDDPDAPAVVDPKSNAADAINIQKGLIGEINALEREYQPDAAANQLTYLDAFLEGTEATEGGTEMLRFNDAGFQAELFEQRPDIKAWWERAKQDEGGARTFDQWLGDVIAVGQKLNAGEDHVVTTGGDGFFNTKTTQTYTADPDKRSIHQELADYALQGLPKQSEGREATKGYLAIMADVQEQIQGYRKTALEADISAVEELGPRAMDAYRQAQPDLWDLMDDLGVDVKESLQQTGLKPADQSRLEDQVRGQYAKAGRSFSNREAQDVFQMTGMQEDQLKNSAYNRAFGLTDRHAKYGLDPFQAILGRSGRVNDASAMAGGAMSTYQDQFDPWAPAIHGSYAANAQNSMNASIAQGNNRSAIIGAGLGAFGSLVGAGLGAAGAYYGAGGGTPSYYPKPPAGG